MKVLLLTYFCPYVNNRVFGWRRAKVWR